jgi:hypothetical protein
VNLTDLLQRSDRSVSIAGSVTPAIVRRRGGAELAVRLEPGSCLKLSDAHEFHVLRTCPTDPGLTRIGDGKLFRQPDLTLELVSGSRRNRTSDYGW